MVALLAYLALTPLILRVAHAPEAPPPGRVPPRPSQHQALQLRAAPPPAGHPAWLLDGQNACSPAVGEPAAMACPWDAGRLDAAWLRVRLWQQGAAAAR